MIDNVVSVLAAGCCLQVRRAIRVADAEFGQVRHDFRGGVEIETGPQLQPVGSAWMHQAEVPIRRVSKLDSHTGHASRTANSEYFFTHPVNAA
jgi:hypothetical protein